MIELAVTGSIDAMLASLRAVLLGDVLSETSRMQLAEWLRACETGAEKLRAGLPAGWVVGDKTGSGSQGESNDVAIVWPPGRAPIIVSAYYTHSDASDDERNAILAAVGQLAAAV